MRCLWGAQVGRGGAGSSRNGEDGFAASAEKSGRARDIDLVPFSKVTGVEPPLPQEWLTDGPLPVGRAFEEYLRPLVGDLFGYAPAFLPAAMGI